MVFSVHKCIMQTFTTSTKWKVLVTHSCLTLCDPMDCSPPGFSVHEICQARILEWVAISSFRGSSRPRDQTQVSGIAGEFFTVWATREALLQNWFDTIHLVFFYCSFYSVPWTSLPWTWVKTPYWNTEHCSWIKWLLTGRPHQVECGSSWEAMAVSAALVSDVWGSSPLWRLLSRVAPGAGWAGWAVLLPSLCSVSLSLLPISPPTAHGLNQNWLQ